MEGRRGVTYAEIAQRYGRDVTTVRNTWAKHPDWPAPVGRRGRMLEFDPAKVDTVVRDHWVRVPRSGGSDEDLLTMREISVWLGVSYAAVRSMASRGELGEPAQEGRPVLYRRGGVRQKRASMRKREPRS